MSPRAPATVIVTVIRLARPRATLSLNVIPKAPAHACATWVFVPFIRRKGGDDAYTDRTVDKMRFVIFVMKVG